MLLLDTSALIGLEKHSERAQALVSEHRVRLWALGCGGLYGSITSMPRCRSTSTLSVRTFDEPTVPNLTGDSQF